MPDIPTEFKQSEIDDLQWAANQLDMTVEEFTAHAANQLVKKSKEDMRQRIQNPKSIKKLK